MKLIVGLMTFAMVFSVVTNTEARGRHHDNDRHDSVSIDVEVENDDTRVLNVAASLANTGLNSQTGSMWTKQSLTTGTVHTVSSAAFSDVNGVIVPACTRCRAGDIKVDVENEDTRVINAGGSVGNSGLNRQTGSSWSQTTGTGAVYGVGSVAESYVNYVDLSVN